MKNLSISRQPFSRSGLSKTFVILAAAVLTACGGAPKQFVGTIDDATMNTLTVCDGVTGELRTFSTEGADTSEAKGLLIGAPVAVDYEGRCVDGARALKIATDATYVDAVGRWVTNDPIAPDSVMGVEIMVGGRAASIRMQTLQYTGWELVGEPGIIVLHGRSIGNRQSSEFMTDAVISEENGRLFMAVDGTDVVYRKTDE